MIGSDYDSFTEFMNACKYHPQKLNAGHVLGKIYPIEQLKQLITHCSIEKEVAGKIDPAQAGKGINNRYSHAAAIADILDSKKIGQALSCLDHDFHFPVVSYFVLPKTPEYKSLNDLKEVLKSKYSLDSKKYKRIFNGIDAPKGPSIHVESISIDRTKNSVSILLSCNRVLLCPDGQSGNYHDYFLARVPIKVTFLLTNRLLEISMPIFAEVPGSTLVEAPRIPERFQFILRSFEKLFSTIVSDEFIPVNFKNLTLYLETKLGASDMGWKIAPQAEAAFDLTQGVLPLKKILDGFCKSLKAEYEHRNREYPFPETNLYNIFRALKENSYTYSLVLEAPFGKRNSVVRISTYYGNPNNGYTPVIVLEKNNEYISNRLRDCVYQSQNVKLQNPYDIDHIMSKSGQ